MWNHPATQRNAKQVLADGAQIVGPGTRWQACRTVGVGRMSEAGEILEAVRGKLATLGVNAFPAAFSP